MFPNLNAEQARNKHTNDFVAKELCLSRRSYELKKKTGEFKLREVNKLLDLYKCDFNYLFKTEQQKPA